MSKIQRLVVKDDNRQVIFDGKIGDTWHEFTIIDINVSETEVIPFDENIDEGHIEKIICIQIFCIKLRDINGIDYRITNNQSDPEAILEKNGVFLQHKQVEGVLAMLAQAKLFEVTY